MIKKSEKEKFVSPKCYFFVHVSKDVVSNNYYRILLSKLKIRMINVLKFNDVEFVSSDAI